MFCVFVLLGSGGIDISDVGGSNQGGNMEEESTHAETDELTLPMSDISIQNTAASVPVPNISIRVPSTGKTSIPIPGSSNNNSPRSNDTTRPSQTANFRPATVRSHITDHPLISKTAYETAV